MVEGLGFRIQGLGVRGQGLGLGGLDLLGLSHGLHLGHLLDRFDLT